MEVPLDYADSEDTSSDSADLSEFVRPILVRKKIPTGSNTQTKRVAKPKRQKKGPPSDLSAIGPKYVLVTDQGPTLEEESERRAKSCKEEGSGYNDDNKRLYEYGESVDGYRLIGDREQYDKWKTQNTKTDQTDDLMEANIDRFAYDGNFKNHRHSSLSKDNFILDYWKREQREFSVLPLLKHSFSSEANVEEITRDSVEQFYLRSCSLLHVELRSLLKSERIFWHPDKMIGKMGKNDSTQLGKITKIFQIINDLWESL